MDFLKDFGVEPVLLLAQIVNFVILLFILQRFLYKPILKVLDERKNKIENSVKQSEEIQRQYTETNEKQTEIMEKTQKESSKIIDEAKREARSLSTQIQEDAKEQAEAILKRNEGALLLEKERIISESKKEIMRLVIATTEKVTEKLLTDHDKDQLVKKAVEEIE